MIVGENVVKRFESNETCIEVLTGVSFEVYRGETIAVVGASGIGKSTFLQIVGALDPPDRGHLYMEGGNVYAMEEAALARLRNEYVGFVFQFHHLLPEFDALENTMMPVLIRSNDRKSARKKAEAMLVRVGLENRIHHRPAELSGGEQQRVAIARALVLKPSLLIADEPTGNLDEKTSDRIHELLASLNRELDMTLIVGTHNMRLASLMARKLTIRDGQIVELSQAGE
ncbi:MAG: ABC transporter ATP-binding protein [Thermodesulfobacteriota bacterium]|nr:ABC transporter ATP-binding protein [Thermodesulfobacteriota bacterium]